MNVWMSWKLSAWCQDLIYGMINAFVYRAHSGKSVFGNQIRGTNATHKYVYVLKINWSPMWSYRSRLHRLVKNNEYIHVLLTEQIVHAYVINCIWYISPSVTLQGLDISTPTGTKYQGNEQTTVCHLRLPFRLLRLLMVNLALHQSLHSDGINKDA
jgi:hypothetical protein